jgi:hypothetical protein
MSELREILEKLLSENREGSRLYTQTTLAQALETNQSAIAQMLKGDQWQAHWNIFLRLIALCNELGIDPYLPPAAWELDKDVIAREVLQHGLEAATRHEGTSEAFAKYDDARTDKRQKRGGCAVPPVRATKRRP